MLEHDRLNQIAEWKRRSDLLDLLIDEGFPGEPYLSGRLRSEEERLSLVLDDLIETEHKGGLDADPTLRLSSEPYWWHVAHGLHNDAHHQTHRPLDACVPLRMVAPDGDLEAQQTARDGVVE